MYAAAGNCHVYVDATANQDWAENIIVNSKVQRPGVCNAAETLLVHKDIAEQFLPRALSALAANGVELRGDVRSRALAGIEAGEIREATEADFDTEFLDLILAVKVVDSAEEAIDHINAHGTGHSEAIVTDSNHAAHLFTTQVDAASVYVNASTRFTDGGEFGFGAEIGIATGRMHARGPVGIEQLTAFKYRVRGSGQVRD
jgi:glutamate-5-semialdehyde dehydrogenase